jgi:outer membrane protein insertion porin family
MPKRWLVGGIWAILMSAGMEACVRHAAAAQPTKQRKVLPLTVAVSEQPPGPEKLIISDVIITGYHRMSPERIKARLRTQPGKEYSPAVVDEDVRELYKTGQFSNICTLLHPDGIDHVKIYFAVREMPNMVQKVTFLGAKHIKPEHLQSITGVRPSTPLNPNLNRQGCQKILEKYAELGRSFADCQLIKGGDLADAEVIYQITEGPKVKVRDIKFEGNTFVSAARLNTQVKSLRQWSHLVGGTYKEQMVEDVAGELYKYYRGFGFQDVRISPETQRSPDGAEVTLIFHIQEGPRYRIQNVPDVHGRQGIPRQQLIALSSFKPGDYFDEETLKRDTRLLTDYMGASPKNEPSLERSASCRK